MRDSLCRTSDYITTNDANDGTTNAYKCQDLVFNTNNQQIKYYSNDIGKYCSTGDNLKSTACQNYYNNIEDMVLKELGIVSASTFNNKENFESLELSNNSYTLDDNLNNNIEEPIILNTDELNNVNVDYSIQSDHCKNYYNSLENSVLDEINVTPLNQNTTTDTNTTTNNNVSSFQNNDNFINNEYDICDEESNFYFYLLFFLLILVIMICLISYANKLSKCSNKKKLDN